MILSDNQDNRITVFHPGAMKHAASSKVSFVQEPIALAIVSANDISTMLEHARDIKQKDIKLIVDPAQQISQMSKQQLRECLHLGDILIVNHHEYAQLQS
jgi:adenosine kinase